MICRLCLKDNAEVIDIFGEIGTELNMAVVLGKYFWFEPKCDDPISTAICNPCWISVANFNEFYLNVEEAHRLLTERFSFKAENTRQRRVLKRPSDEEDTVAVLPCKIKRDAEERSNDDDDAEDEVDLQIKAFFDCEENHENAQSPSKQEELQLHRSSAWEDDNFSMGSETLIEVALATAESGDDEDALALPKESKQRVTRANAAASPTSIAATKATDATETSEDASALRKDSNCNRRITRASAAISRPPTPPPTQPPPLVDNNSPSCKELDKPNVSSTTQSQTCADTRTITRKRRGRPPKSKSNDFDSSKSSAKTNRRYIDPDEAMLSFEARMQLVDEKIAKCMRLTCDICSVEHSTFLELRKHMELLHKVKGYVKCCGKKFSKRALLKEHVETHLNPDCYKCNDCNKSFADKQCMRNHILIKHQPEEAKVFQCERCPKRFARSYILEQHRLIHEDRNHICVICQRGFASSNMLSTHIRNKHSNHGTKMCDICAKVIRGRTAFARHQLEHTGVVLPKVQCDKCGSWHKDKYSLQKHKRRHNDEGEEFVCNVCGKRAPNRSALLSHQRYVHKSQRSFECSVCQKAFKKSINLKEHMAMHTGEVLYRCPHCPRTFNSNANMHSHRKKMHPKEFEETRKLRHLNIPTKPIIDQKWRKKAKVEDEFKEEHSEEDEDEIPQIITINDGQETHNILVTTDDCSDNEVELSAAQSQEF